MISYLGSLVQFSPAMGSAGRCRQISLCVDSTHCVPATLVCPIQGCLCFPHLHCSGSRLLCMEQALYPVRFQFSGPPQQRGFGCACVLCLPRPQWFRQPKALRALSRVRRAFSLRGPSVRCRSGLRKSSDRNQGPVCSVGGGGFSGAEFSPFPSSLPPTSSGDGAALLCSFSVPLFCEPPAVCSVRLIFPCSPTV